MVYGLYHPLYIIPMDIIKPPLPGIRHYLYRYSILESWTVDCISLIYNFNSSFVILIAASIFEGQMSRLSCYVLVSLSVILGGCQLPTRADSLAPHQTISTSSGSRGSARGRVGENLPSLQVLLNLLHSSSIHTNALNSENPIAVRLPNDQAASATGKR